MVFERVSSWRIFAEDLSVQSLYGLGLLASVAVLLWVADKTLGIFDKPKPK